jgi:hypothetical protein
VNKKIKRAHTHQTGGKQRTGARIPRARRGTVLPTQGHTTRWWEEVKPHKRSAGDVWEESGKEIVHTMRTQRHARKERASAHVVGDERACGWGRHRGAHTTTRTQHARKERAGAHVVGDESACGWGRQRFGSVRRCASGGAGKKTCTPPTCPGTETRKGAGWHETGAPSWITGARCAERGETRNNHHAGSERGDA